MHFIIKNEFITQKVISGKCSHRSKEKALFRIQKKKKEARERKVSAIVAFKKALTTAIKGLHTCNHTAMRSMGHSVMLNGAMPEKVLGA